MCYTVCGMVHIKEPLLLIGKSSPCGGSVFPPYVSNVIIFGFTLKKFQVLKKKIACRVGYGIPPTVVQLKHLT